MKMHERYKTAKQSIEFESGLLSSLKAMSIATEDSVCKLLKQAI